MEMLVLTWGIDYLHRNLPRFMRSERRRVALPMRLGSARVEYQPLGVIGIVAPWNYPFSLALMPLATALAAGNRAMIKPSEIVKQATLKVYEGAGHGLPITLKDRLNADLLEFCRAGAAVAA